MVMCVFDITLKCIIVVLLKYNLLHICCLIRHPAKPICETLEFRQAQIL